MVILAYGEHENKWWYKTISKITQLRVRVIDSVRRSAWLPGANRLRISRRERVCVGRPVIPRPSSYLLYKGAGTV